MPVIEQVILVLLGVTLGMSVSNLIATTPRKERK